MTHLSIDQMELLQDAMKAKRPVTSTLPQSTITRLADDLGYTFTRDEVAHIAELKFRDLDDFTSWADEYTRDRDASNAYKAELEAEAKAEAERVENLRPADAAREVVEAYLRAQNPFA